ncbi:trigger factor [Caproiciproducens sp. MSJ-32]|uniref:trigger factor n=1 Tax=Caproiciproducens sp. MSJ-32 TaxID=2841527 RepID=UPI001C10C61A|nr:trigger factor [Caproiciproducens sp. MSJ-32]MBU5454240.1 trigger factor [Caproiciproducens sp. MSJ-32]
MKAKMEKIEKNLVKLEITVEAEKFDEAIKKAYKKNVKSFNVPGFRKGKVPINIVKKYYGIGVLLEDAINFAIDSSYGKALEENDIKPVDYPNIDIITAEEGKDFVYTAEVTVYPEVQLGEYKGLKVERPTYPVTDEDVENRLKEMQEKNARIESKEDGEIAKGDIAVIDFKGFIDDVAFEGGEGKDYSLEIGSGTFIDNFEDQLVGAKVGDKVDVNVTFPENYGREDLNNKKARFEVLVKDIKVKELPALDDEFASEASEFETLAELKEDIKAKLEKNNKAREEREFEDAVLKAVVENATIDVPEVMVEKEIDSMLKDLEQRLKYQGLSLEQYYQFTGSDEAKTRDFMRENALNKVKTDLVLQEIIDVENIEATEEDIKERAKEVAEMYSAASDEKMIDLLIKNQRSALEYDVKIQKTLNFLVENNQ